MWLEWLPILKFLVWDDVVSCADFLFGIFDMCFIRQCSVQCDANIHLVCYTGKSSKSIMAEVFTSRGISTQIIFIITSIIIAIFVVIVSLIGTVLLIVLCRAVSHYHLRHLECNHAG